MTVQPSLHAHILTRTGTHALAPETFDRNKRGVLDVDEKAKVEESSCGTGVAAPQTWRQLQLERRQPVFGKHRDPGDNADIDRDGIHSDGTDDYDINDGTAGATAGIEARGTPIFGRAQKRQRDAGSAPGTATSTASATAAAKAATIIVIVIVIVIAINAA